MNYLGILRYIREWNVASTDFPQDLDIDVLNIFVCNKTNKITIPRLKMSDFSEKTGFLAVVSGASHLAEPVLF